MEKIKNKLKKIYHESNFGKKVLFVPFLIYELLIYRLLSKKYFLMIRFKRVFGYRLNLKNPETLNEKLQWKKLYDKNPLYSQCADKVKVRHYVKQKVGPEYLVDICGIYSSAFNIDFLTLPEKFVIKSNHASGQIILVKNKNTINWNQIVKKCNQWLRSKHYLNTKEFHYKNIPPKIIIEKLLMNSDGGFPFDFKFHCFHGKIEAIQVDVDRFSDHKRSFYNASWELIPMQWCLFLNGKPIYKMADKLPKPDNFDKMTEISQKLSEDFDYVRVDLYNVDGRIYFGELTFNHGSGYEQFEPEEYDLYFGHKLNMPLK